ncbi:hypothetical protein TNCV_4276341 [Trichonephila clavipes]|nr:hypothetical protein TNCV_4276341 [Trichonephila clavipes]
MSISQKRKIRKEKEYNINSKYAKLDNFLISASSSCASASSSNAGELDEQSQAHPWIHKRKICGLAHFEDLIYPKKIRGAQPLKRKNRSCIVRLIVSYQMEDFSSGNPPFWSISSEKMFESIL